MTNVVSQQLPIGTSSEPRFPDTLVKGFFRTVDRYPDIVAARTSDGKVSLTWKEVYQRVEALAGGLWRIGVRHGDTVALMVKNRPEFLIADLAVICLGATPFSIYATLPSVQIVPLLENSDAKIVLCERAFLDQIRGAQEAWPALSKIVLLESDDTPGTLNWSDLETGCEGFDFKSVAAEVKPDDLATLVYTSGSTGPAKGVEWEHSSVIAFATAIEHWISFSPAQRILSWLPTAHTTERVAGHYLPFLAGSTITYLDDTSKILDVVKEVRPNIFFSPPRMWEKIKIGIESRWATLPEMVQHQMREALQRGIERVRLGESGQAIPASLKLACAKDDENYFAPIRKSLGLDADGLFVGSGGSMAPIPVLEFFHAIGLPLEEAYGLTESAGLGTRSPKGKNRIGTVGKAQPGVEVKLAEDGEILIRHPGVMRGYRKQPEATAAAKDADGWLHTGDVGAVDADGYFRIVDRKKDIIINSFGKNMSPANIEGALTSGARFISQAVVVGDGHNYNVALLTLDSTFVMRWAQEHRLPNSQDIDLLSRNPEIVAQVDSEVKRANEQLARVEQIKRFQIVGGEWLPGTDIVTATMKLKRRAILHRYEAEIEALYSEQGVQ